MIPHIFAGDLTVPAAERKIKTPLRKVEPNRKLFSLEDVIKIAPFLYSS